jgi:hypothetical protein
LGRPQTFGRREIAPGVTAEWLRTVSGHGVVKPGFFRKIPPIYYIAVQQFFDTIGKLSIDSKQIFVYNGVAAVHHFGSRV